MKKAPFLDHVKAIVCGAREEDYGTAQENFSNIADLWNCFLDMDISSQEVAVMMMLLKIARLKKNPNHEDSVTDIAGYAACHAEIIHEENS